MNNKISMRTTSSIRSNNSLASAIAIICLTLFGATLLSQNSVRAQVNTLAFTSLLRDGGDLLKAGKLNEAKDKYLEALTQDSLNQHALKNVGYILTLQSDFKNSLGYLVAAEKIGNTDADIYNLLAVAYGGVGDTISSLTNYRKAVNLAPSKVSYLKNYGAALVSAGRFTAGISILDSAKSIDPGDGEISFLLGNCYAGLSQPKEAIRNFRSAMEFNYDTGELRYHLGMVSESIGDFWSAEEHYGLGIAKAPKNLELRQRLAVLYLRTGVYDQARRLLKDNLSHDPNFINSRVALGACYAHLGFPDSANIELQNVKNTDSKKYEVMKNLVEGATKQYNDSKNANPRSNPDSAATR